MNKRWIKLLFWSLFVICLTSVSGFADPLKDGTLVIGMTGDPNNLDPHGVDAMWDNTMTINIFDPLIRKVANEKGEVNFEPALAVEWEQKDAVTWILTLRKGVKFHNGNDLTADDVVFSYQRYKEGDGKGFVRAIESVRMIDDQTVEVKTFRPYAVLVLDMSNIYISDKEYFEEVGEEGILNHPVGTGPYKFVEWIKEDHITLVANPHYWGPNPSIKKVMFRPLSNDATRVAALLSGEVHLIYNLPVRDIERVMNTKNTEVIGTPGPDIMHICFDITRENTPGFKGGKNPFLDKRVREAFALAIDKEAIIEHVYNGNGYLAAQLPIPGANGYVESLKPYPYDPERAKKLMVEAGYADGFDVVWDVPSQRYLNDGPNTQAIAGYLAKVGIRTELNFIPSNQYLDYIRPGDKTTMYYGASGTGKGDIGGWYNALFFTRGKQEGYGGANRTHYSNPRVDELLIEANSTPDIEVRKKCLEEATKIIYDDYAFIAIFQYRDNYGAAKGVNFKPRVDSYIFQVADISIKE